MITTTGRTWREILQQRVEQYPLAVPSPGQREPGKEQCLWVQDLDGYWGSSCNQAFILTDGTPTENEMRYCCHCGKPLKEGKA